MSKNMARRSRQRLRARNALLFCRSVCARGSRSLPCPFRQSRRSHRAFSQSDLSGIPFSITAHGQDFMSDLGQDDLLREICARGGIRRGRNRIQPRPDAATLPRNRLERSIASTTEWIQRILKNFRHHQILRRPPLIVSVGRLVAFKGFENLIAACALLNAKGLDFRCEIIGDGPLREKLQEQNRCRAIGVVLSRCADRCSQAQVFEALQRSDIFALASIVDGSGASDVFPTVIQEAMACARPVVSTQPRRDSGNSCGWQDRISCRARRCFGPGRRSGKIASQPRPACAIRSSGESTNRKAFPDTNDDRAVA